MSVYETVFERFHATNPADDYADYAESDFRFGGLDIGGIIAAMQRKITRMCAELLSDNSGSEVSRFYLTIELDGEMTEYSAGKHMSILSQEIQWAIKNMVKVQNIKVEFSYDFIWRAWKDDLLIGPHTMKELLSECPDVVFDYVDYTLYYNSDCTDTVGEMTMFGKQNGVLNRGEMEYTQIYEVPSFGEWSSPQTISFVLDARNAIDNKITPERAERFREFAIELSPLNSYECFDDIVISDDFLEFVLNDARLNSKEDIEKFIKISSEFAKFLHSSVTEPDEFMFKTAEFCDLSESGPNILRLDFDKNGDVTMLGKFIR